MSVCLWFFNVSITNYHRLLNETCIWIHLAHSRRLKHMWKVALVIELTWIRFESCCLFFNKRLYIVLIVKPTWFSICIYIWYRLSVKTAYVNIVWFFFNQCQYYQMHICAHSYINSHIFWSLQLCFDDFYFNLVHIILLWVLVIYPS